MAHKRGFGAEKRTVYREKGGVGEIRQEYHLTEPVKITLGEKARLTKWTIDLLGHCRRIHSESKVAYVGLYPRFIDRCCDREGHMDNDDIWVMHNMRREFDNDIEVRSKTLCETVKWYETLGMDKEPELGEVRHMRVMDIDGVHLTTTRGQNAAVNICCRLLEEDIVSFGGGGGGKKRRRV